MQKQEGKYLFIQLKVKGGALYVAIIISIVVGVLLSIFILLSRLNQRQLISFLQKTQLQIDLESAMSMAQSSYYQVEQNGKWIKNTFNDDSMRIIKEYWGAYELITVEAKNRHQVISSSALFGVDMSKDTGLVVNDNGRPIGLSGNIVLKANCYLTSAGVKPSFIEGRSYVSTPSNAGHIKGSGMELFDLNKDFIQGVEDQWKGESNINDSSGIIDQGSIFIPFTKRALMLSNQSGYLKGLNLSGHIKLIGKDLIIDSTCKLNDVLIICNKVKFANGFKGNVHVIASDSVVCGKHCSFYFPSSFVLMGALSSINGMSQVEIGEDNLFEGGLIAYGGDAALRKTFVKIQSTAKVCGFVYAPLLHLEGKIHANVYAGKLLLKTPSAVYENHFMSCEIDPAKYAGVLAIPRVGKLKSNRVKCASY